MATKKDWTSRTVRVSSKYTARERQAIAYDIISYIQDRTKAGKGEGNKKWKPPANKYTKEYKASIDFKLKPDQSGRVNLTLTGDMLDSIKRLKGSDTAIKYGISKGDSDHGKAEGNIRGTYGKKRGSSSRARDFLTLSKAEKDKILARYPLKDNEERKKSVLETVSALKAAEDIVDGKR